jgi:hypothetical protein
MDVDERAWVAKPREVEETRKMRRVVILCLLVDLCDLVNREGKDKVAEIAASWCEGEKG